MRRMRFLRYCENICDRPSHSTAKVIDCFCGGDASASWSRNSRLGYTPSNCHIHCRLFSGAAAVSANLIAVGHAEYPGYKESTAVFVPSNLVRSFTYEAFAEPIVKSIAHDIDRSA